MLHVRAGERLNVYSHLAGLLLAMAGAPWMLVRALRAEGRLTLVGISVFLLSVWLVYAASALFHGSRGTARARWQRADHCAIYLLIAGTYTPYALMTTPGPWTGCLLTAVWACAGLGIARELQTSPATPPPLGLYVALGWFTVAAAVPLAAGLGAAELSWLLGGAALYSVGTVFYRNRRGLPCGHGLWHLCVLGGTASHYIGLGQSLS